MARKHLIFAAVGDKSLHGMWAPHADRTYDLWLIYYGNDEARAEQYRGECDQFWREKGQKLHLMEHMRDRGLYSYEGYDYVWFPDDDIAITPDQIERFFEIMAEEQLDIAQPGLIGYANHPITRVHRPFKLRWTNFVEVMAPAFSAEALMRCAPSFKENVSSYGLDHLWWHVLRCPERGLGIVDEVPMLHTRAFQSKDRYDYAYGEALAVFEKYKISRKIYIHGGKVRGVPVGRTVARVLNRLFNGKAKPCSF